MKTLYIKFTYILEYEGIEDKKVISEYWVCNEKNNVITKTNRLDSNELEQNNNFTKKILIHHYAIEIFNYEKDIMGSISIKYLYDNNSITFKKESKIQTSDEGLLKLILKILKEEQDQDFRLTSIEYNIYGTTINIPARILCPRDNTFFNYQQAIQLAVDNKLQYSIPELTNNIISRILSGNDYSVEASFVYAMIFSGILENINKIINSNLKLLNIAA